MIHASLRTGAEGVRQSFVRRFTPRLWTVDFPRPMMAALTNPAPRVVRVDLSFVTDGDLAGLIWTSEDRWSHPLLAYETRRDYRGTILSFEWVAGPGLMPLAAVNGPTLTIEGRDAEGRPRTWYVRLWNYARVVGGRTIVELPFGELKGGFLLPDEADPVHAADIDRLFISLVPSSYTGAGAPLPARVDTWVELRDLDVRGAGRMLAVGDPWLPEHALRMTSGYDDCYHQAPERLVEQWRALGYRGLVGHYVGMSHFYAVRFHAGRFEVDPTVPMNVAALAWHRALARAGAAAGLRLVFALSYEVLDANAPAAWAQRRADGQRALTGWVPPSTLVSPCRPEAMAWLAAVAAQLVQIQADAGLAPWFQVGEPWWWVGPDHVPCFYDEATVARYQQETGQSPPLIHDIRGPKSAAERAFLDWLGARLAESTAALVAAVRAAVPQGVTSSLLFYTPQVVHPTAPDLVRANLPAAWAPPAFDVLQLEDYDFLTADDEAGSTAGWRAVDARLGYPRTSTHYYAGFVREAPDAEVLWPRIVAGARAARERGVAEVFLWAWPQIARDGLVVFETEDEVEPFHDVSFPLPLGLEARGGPEFSTRVAMLASGFEQRAAAWDQPLLRFDAGLGVRSEEDLKVLVEFFRARRGQAHGFRLRDPLDHDTALAGSAVGPTDVLIGVGDGQRLSFPLVKRYGSGADAAVRRITRPVAGSVRVAVDGVEQRSGWALLPMGVVRFDEPPPAGAEVRAGFLFDVPVRFATDRLDVSLSAFRAGEALSVPMVELREA
ncbi:MAG: DUF2460 domain-containing protein [Sphingomonadaceae bacterium]|uniref:DUF2460 domain-containing protein n=1 Tax=Thermaurantiacus sp. TaxID=2820283 RepID=UPI00298F0716|nr:DUF2460 domain-containing protein [Thermaurantiacus sp.]MCS6987772.1 DUF2460 domain-containing protein [Sphingomonadaceae bacterium]MDW8415007.1 DUF2460 domain-containing protein [Thermaurantiacus sp.]